MPETDEFICCCKNSGLSKDNSGLDFQFQKVSVSKLVSTANIYIYIVQSGQPLEYCDGGTKLRQIVKHSNKPERPKAPDKKKPGKGVRRKERESVCQAAGRKDLFSSWLLQRPF